ncbi:hypothetical protein ScPMuIL_010927 [Solemya velum]
MASGDVNVTEILDTCVLLLKAECDEVQFRAALETILKIFRNVLAHPGEEKYKSIKTENKTFNSRVWRFSGSQQLLLASGWTEVDGHVVLTDDTRLKDIIGFIETSSYDNRESQRSSLNSKEADAKQEKLNEDRKKQQDQYKKMMMEKKRISEMIKADRQETSARKSKDSHATHMDGQGGMKRYDDIGIDVNKGGG